MKKVFVNIVDKNIKDLKEFIMEMFKLMKMATIILLIKMEKRYLLLLMQMEICNLLMLMEILLNYLKMLEEEHQFYSIK